MTITTEDTQDELRSLEIEECTKLKWQTIECTKKLISGSFSLLDVQMCNDTSDSFQRCAENIKNIYNEEIYIDGSELGFPKEEEKEQEEIKEEEKEEENP